MDKKHKKLEMSMKNRPHVVILGAGASVATIPNGDKNKLKITCMNDFLFNIGQQHIIDSVKLETKSSNIEDIFSEIYEKSKSNKEYNSVLKKLEHVIFNHFIQYEIPEEPTIYDFLLLGLTNKDLIASFNWDPLLIQAGLRLIKKGIVLNVNLPKCVFLHGNVGIKFDYLKMKVDLVNHVVDEKECKLLYPVKEKNYNEHILIHESWKMLEDYLNRAYILTIFGYSAPTSDVEALNMLKNAWGDSKKRYLEQIEIIDLKSKDELVPKWKNFINDDNFFCISKFEDSMIFKYPRRTADVLFDASMMSLWINSQRGFSSNMSFEDLKEYIKPLLMDEILNPNVKFNPYIENANFK